MISWESAFPCRVESRTENRVTALQQHSALKKSLEFLKICLEEWHINGGITLFYKHYVTDEVGMVFTVTMPVDLCLMRKAASP